MKTLADHVIPEKLGHHLQLVRVRR
uniref:Uncharacterized protein n=1 Tax=Anguilla anguilla TaxID=7936 RepID=A0A0E9TQR3_ANGAN